MGKVDNNGQEASSGSGDGGGEKSPEVIELANLQQKLGQQGSELGNLRKENQELKTANENPPEPAPDFSAEKAEIQAKVKSGDMSMEDGLIALDEINQSAMGVILDEKLSQKDSENALRSDAEKFQGEAPDFAELRESGALEQIKAEMPSLHDDMSAYLTLKLRESSASVEAAMKEGYEKGKAEKQKLDDGAVDTGSVLSDDGGDIRNVKAPSKNMSEGEKTDAMYARLQKHRKDKLGG